MIGLHAYVFFNDPVRVEALCRGFGGREATPSCANPDFPVAASQKSPLKRQHSDLKSKIIVPIISTR
jgi:hypothetical protein